MSRSRRSSRVRTPKRSRLRADWVYRANNRVLGTGVLGNDTLGTYEPTVKTQNGGVAAASGNVLYDSKNYIGTVTRGGIGAVINQASLGVIPTAARAAGKKPCMLAMEGVLYIEPQAWVLGNVMAVGVRLGVFEQDLSGVFSIDVGYSMWRDETVFAFSSPAHWADDKRRHAKEWRFFKAFGDASTTPLIVGHLRWRGRRYLEDYECFGLYTELGAAGIGVRMQYWCRTLVSDEG